MNTVTTNHTPIPGYPGYLATADGVVWSVSNWRGYGIRQLVPILDTDGYYKVRLTIDGKRINRKVHKLIALTFLGEPALNHEVCHIDGSRANNAISNLMWGTRKLNASHRASHGRTSHGEKHSQAIKLGFKKGKVTS